jgi:hypothetical protein
LKPRQLLFICRDTPQCTGQITLVSLGAADRALTRNNPWLIIDNILD